MPLFEVAILEEPTEKARKDGKAEKLVFGPQAVVARDSQSAGIAAVLGSAKDIKVDKSRMQVLVRPFG